MGVALDAVLATLTGMTAAVAMTEGESQVGLPLVLWSSAHLGSAIAGNSASSRCSAAHEAHQRWLESQAAAGPSISDDGDEDVWGRLGGRCYGNDTCNAGLSCSPEKRCVAVDPAVAAAPEAQSAAAAATQPSPAIQHAQPGPGAARQAKTQPASPVPERELPLLLGPGVWADFWREVKQ